MTHLTPDEYKEADRTLELCEKLQLVKLTPVSVELDKRFEEHFQKQECTVQDLNQENMWKILTSYFKKNHEAERGEIIKWMDTLDNDFIIEREFYTITKYISDMLEDLELDQDTIPESVGLPNEATFHCRVLSCNQEMEERKQR